MSQHPPSPSAAAHTKNSGVFYYVLPGVGIYGGVKKGFHCAELLRASGFPCTVATPDGTKPTWFETSAPVISWGELVLVCRGDDTVLFSYPPNSGFVNRLAARRRIVHMQGANTSADVSLFSRHDYEFISHGLHMSHELLRHGRVAPYVPIGVPDVFRWSGQTKEPASVAVMSRKRPEFLPYVVEGLPEKARLVVIDGLAEVAVAERLKRCDVFVAISVDEAFGLPPLEAMCAGCCVVGFPGVGGFEFMRHGETAHVVANGDAEGLTRALREVLARPSYREALRQRALQLSAYYNLKREQEFLLRAIGLAGT